MRVYANLESMRKVCEQPEARAACGVERGASRKRLRATLFFCEGYTDLYYIAHECVHAAYAIGRWGVHPWQDSFDNEEEERVAYPAGQLTEDIARNIRDLGFPIGL